MSIDGRTRRGARWVGLLATGALLVACERSASSPSGRIADVESQAARGTTMEGAPAADAASSRNGRGLARAAGGADGQQYVVGRVDDVGFISGRITGVAPRDTLITPTHDTRVCAPFREAVVSGRRDGIAQVVVWLEGVARGPRSDAPRIASLVYDGCRLSPRIQSVAVGGTVMVKGRDALFARLQFVEEGSTTTRETVFLTDAGQVVPSTAASSSPGLVHVRDDKHPWVHAWLVIAPHPFVRLADDDGTFRFDGVPAGTYQLVTWHERLGTQRQRVKIVPNIETKLDVRY